MAFDNSEDTQIINAREAKELFQEENTEEAILRADQPEPSKLPSEEPPSSEATLSKSIGKLIIRPASIADRATAFLIDLLVLWNLYWAMVQVYMQWRFKNWDIAAPTNLQLEGILFHIAILLLYFLYFISFEGLFGATIGKWCCKLRVKLEGGSPPSWMAVITRNTLRALDMLPLGLLALASMEWSKQNQRVGDLAAGTIVVKQTQEYATTDDFIPVDNIATTTGRLISGSVDLALLFSSALAMMGLLNSEQRFYSRWLSIAGPGLLLRCWSLLQVFMQSTPGLWICGYRIAKERGERMDFAAALRRTALLPLDLLAAPVAWLLSPRRQRLGDSAAGTVVIRAGWSHRGAVGTVAAIMTIALLTNMALHNEHGPIATSRNWSDPYTWLNQKFTWSVLPSTEIGPDFTSEYSNNNILRLVGFRFAADQPNNTRSPAVFLPRETAIFVMEVHGATTKENMIWIQEDLSIRFPDGSYGLRQENIIDMHQIKRTRGPIELTNSVKLPDWISPGEYTVYITIRDRLNEEAHPVTQSQTFYVKPLS